MKDMELDTLAYLNKHPNETTNSEELFLLSYFFDLDDLGEFDTFSDWGFAVRIICDGGYQMDDKQTHEASQMLQQKFREIISEYKDELYNTMKNSCFECFTEIINDFEEKVQDIIDTKCGNIPNKIFANGFDYGFEE